MSSDSELVDETVHWEAVPSISRLAFVGRLNGRAVGIIDWDGTGYRAATLGGTILGTFPHVELAESALNQHLGLSSPAPRAGDDGAPKQNPSG